MKDSGVWEGYLREIKACHWNRKGNRVISRDRDNSIKVWDGTTGRELATLGSPLMKAGSALAFSADLDRIAIPGKAAVVEISQPAGGPSGGGISTEVRGPASALHRFELKRFDDLAAFIKGEDLENLKSRTQSFIRGDASLQGPYPLIDSDDFKVTIESLYTIKVYDGETGNERSTYGGHDAWVTACAFDPGGRVAASGDARGTIRLWEVESGKEIAVLEMGRSHQGDPAEGGPLSADPTDLSSWLAAEEEAPAGKSHARAVRALAFSPDGKWLTSGSDDHTLKVWDTGTGQEITVLTGHLRRVGRCAMSADGTRVISADAEGEIKIWDTLTGREIATLGGRERSVEFECPADAKRLVTLDSAHHLRLWDAERGSMLRDFPDTAWYALGPDGKQLVLNGRDGTLTLWRTDSASQETRFETGNGWFGSLALSADGKLLFGAGGNTYALWDVKRVSMLARLEGFGFRSRTCAFSPDGGRVAVGGGAGNVHILRLENREAPAG